VTLMQIFVVIVEDRHIDVDVEVYSDRAVAIARARAVAEANAVELEDIEEDDNCTPYEYYADYSTEGDCVRVVAKILDTASE
jgi:hypothetical protein